MANIGDKFIITIGDKAENEQSGETLYRIKGFKSLVFDENGIEKLEKYEGHNVKAPTREPIEVGSIVCYSDLWRGVVLQKNLKNNYAIVLNENDTFLHVSLDDIYATGVKLNGTQFVMGGLFSAFKDTIKDWGEENE